MVRTECKSGFIVTSLSLGHQDGISCIYFLFCNSEICHVLASNTNSLFFQANRFVILVAVFSDFEFCVLHFLLCV